MSLSSLNPGKLDRLATPRIPTTARGTAGGVVLSWADSATKSWAQWLPTGGREFLAASAQHAELTGVLRIRYRSDLRPTWRMVVGGVLYDVVAVQENGRLCYLDVSLKTSPISDYVITDESGNAITDESGNSITSD